MRKASKQRHLADAEGTGYRAGMQVDRWLASWKRLPHPIRWVVVATIGLSLIVAGIAMLVLPGPGIATIIAGLAVLATEFAWARVVLSHVKKHGSKAATATKDTALRVVRRSPKPAVELEQ